MLIAEVWPLKYPLTASVAARDLALLGRGDPRTLARTLGASLARSAEHADWVSRDPHIPWVTGHLRFSLIQALCVLPDEAFDSQLDVVAAVLREYTNAYVYDSIAAPVVERVLGDQVVDVATRRHDLPLRALPILDAIRDSPLWVNPRIGNPIYAMRQRGFAYDREFWVRMLQSPVVEA